MKTKIKENGRRAAVPVLRTQKLAGKKRVVAPAAAPEEESLRVNSILVPIDFSTLSKKSLRYAVSFARKFDARLTLLFVVEPVTAVAFPGLAPLVMENDKVVAACKGKIDQLIKESGVAAKLIEKILVRVGRSFAEIADVARTRKVDLIVISTHGYTGIKHGLLGSTTERVVRFAPCPVLVVREQERELLSK